MSTAMKNADPTISDSKIEELTGRNAENIKKGSILRRYRLQAELTQREAAERINVSPGWICSVENGRASPTEKHLSDLVYELDHNMTEFYEEVEESVMRTSACSHCAMPFGKPHACVALAVQNDIRRKARISIVKGRKAARL